MGKVRTRVLGLEEVEEKQKKQQKERTAEKKLKEAKAPEAEKAKEVKQAAPEAKEEKGQEAKVDKKKVQKARPPRKRGVRYATNKRLVDKSKSYNPQEAVAILKKMKPAGFDESLELHINVDETGLKGEVALPHATGKVVRVQIVDDATIEKIQKGKIEFDVLVTHPSFMPKLAPLAKILGPRGMMPNPKAGTISDKPEELAKKFSSGTIKWKTEGKAPIIHQIVGKVSAADKELVDNIQAFTKAVGKNHIQTAFVTSSMSPSVPLSVE